MISPPLIELTVEPYQQGLRLDQFLSQQLRNYSSWKIERLRTAGLITVNHLEPHPKQKLQTGDKIQVSLVDPPVPFYEAEDLPLSIIYEDPWILVIDKAAGTIAHPTGDVQSGTLVHAIQAHCDQQTIVRGLIRPGIVHRLDRETSGVMIIAKTHQSHRRLVESFESHRVQKSYLALAEGTPDQNTGVITLPIGQSRQQSQVLMSTRPDATNQKPAKTIWSLVQAYESYSLFEAIPKTGGTIKSAYIWQQLVIRLQVMSFTWPMEITNRHPEHRSLKDESCPLSVAIEPD